MSPEGFIAAHIVQQLFAQGYTVVGTVRSSEKGDWIAARTPGFKYEIVKELTADGAFDDVFKKHPDITYVIHTASPVGLGGGDFVKSMVDPAILGTKSVLHATHEYGKQVKKFVVTSSGVAAYAISQVAEARAKGTTFSINEDSWSPVTLEEANKGMHEGYGAAKKFSEKLVWDFKESAKPSFDIVTILAPMVYGPPIHQVTYEGLGSLFGFFKGLLDAGRVNNIPRSYSDVRDIARTHVLALKSDTFNNQRWLPFAGLLEDQIILDILHHYRPEESASINLVKGEPGARAPGSAFQYDNSKTLKALGFDFIPFSKTILDLFDGVYALKQQSKTA